MLRERSAIATLRAEWDDLVVASESAAIFHSFDWAMTWLTVARPDVRPLVIAIRDEHDRLVALAPFYFSRFRLLRLVPRRVLRIIGDEDSAAEYPDLIIRRGSEAAIDAVAAQLRQLSREWDLIWLPGVADWSGGRSRWEALAGAADLLCCRRSHECSSIALPSSHDEYMAMLPHKRRAYVRRETRNLLAEADVQLVYCDASSIEARLTTLFELHRARWRMVGQDGAFERRPALRRFFETFGPLAAARGAVRVWELQRAGVPIATQFGYVSGRTYFAIQEGFDPASAGAGNVLRNLSIRDCIEEGLTEYDFLGEYSDHKRLWRAQPREGSDLLIGPPGAVNKLIFHRGIWPTGRFLRPVAVRSAAR